MANNVILDRAKVKPLTTFSIVSKHIVYLYTVYKSKTPITHLHHLITKPQDQEPPKELQLTLVHRLHLGTIYAH